MKRRCLTLAAALALWPLGALAQSLDVLWYAYSPSGSPSGYREDIEQLAEVAPSLSSAGVRWRLTFFGPGDRPDFEAYDVLVVESSFTYIFDGLDFPDYSGILDNDAGIRAARGSRTLLTGSFADLSLRDSPATSVKDSIAGVLVNWVNWAGSGTGLGIVALDDEDWAWKRNPRSFLRDEYSFTDQYFDCCGGGYIPEHARDWPINEGISDATAGRVTPATSAFKVPPPDGYAVVIADWEDERDGTPAAGTIATASEAAGSTVPREEHWCERLEPPLHKPLTLPNRANPRLPVRMRLLDESGGTVDAGDVASAPQLTVSSGTRTQTVGPFTYHARARMWMAPFPNDATRERGTHTIEAIAGDASYDVELCSQTVTRR